MIILVMLLLMANKEGYSNLLLLVSSVMMMMMTITIIDTVVEQEVCVVFFLPKEWWVYIVFSTTAATSRLPFLSSMNSSFVSLSSEGMTGSRKSPPQQQQYSRSTFLSSMDSSSSKGIMGSRLSPPEQQQQYEQQGWAPQPSPRLRVVPRSSSSWMAASRNISSRYFVGGFLFFFCHLLVSVLPSLLLIIV